MAYFAGIDSGGSKTRCLVGDEASILGKGHAGSSKLARVGEKAAKEALLQSLRDACDQAKITLTQLDSICVGMAGASSEDVVRTVRGLLADSVSAKVEIAGDMVIALEAAAGDGPSVIVIAGTGSIAYGRNLHGETARAGGLGTADSDEGSGTWIGRRAAEKQLVKFASAANYSQLFPQVASLADHGNVFARQVLEEAGAELAQLASKVLRQLWNDSDPVNVYVAGGVFENSAVVRNAFSERLGTLRAGISFSGRLVQPVEGALELARKAMMASARKC
jgi:N-acetylglucosamine kinase-like BadF-type ATPase